jgi:hypothetical protein
LEIGGGVGQPRNGAGACADKCSRLDGVVAHT